MSQSEFFARNRQKWNAHSEFWQPIKEVNCNAHVTGFIVQPPLVPCPVLWHSYILRVCSLLSSLNVSEWVSEWVGAWVSERACVRACVRVCNVSLCVFVCKHACMSVLLNVCLIVRLIVCVCLIVCVFVCVCVCVCEQMCKTVCVTDMAYLTPNTYTCMQTKCHIINIPQMVVWYLTVTQAVKKK